MIELLDNVVLVNDDLVVLRVVDLLLLLELVVKYV